MRRDLDVREPAWQRSGANPSGRMTWYKSPEEKTNLVNARLRKEAGGATASGGEVAAQEGRGQIMKDLVRPGERCWGSSR